MKKFSKILLFLGFLALSGVVIILIGYFLKNTTCELLGLVVFLAGLGTLIASYNIREEANREVRLWIMQREAAKVLKPTIENLWPPPAEYPPDEPRELPPKLTELWEAFYDFKNPHISDDHFEALKARWPKLSADLALLGDEGNRRKIALLARITATQLAETLTGNIDDLDTWEGLISLLGTVRSDFEITQKQYFEKRR